MSTTETANAPAPAAPRMRRKDARPGELLEAALQLFVSKGYAATRVQEVAALAGVSKGTLFLYFPSKQALFEAVVRQYMVSVIELGDAELETRTEPASVLLKEALLRWWHLINSQQVGGLPKLVVSESENFPSLAQFYIREVIQPGFGLIGKILARGMRSGEFRELDILMTAQSLWSGMSYMMLWERVFAPHASEPRVDAQAFIEHHITTLCHGLMAFPNRGSN